MILNKARSAKVTLFGCSIISLISLLIPFSVRADLISEPNQLQQVKAKTKASSAYNNSLSSQAPKNIQTTQSQISKPASPDYIMSAIVQVSRSTNLVDFQDGSRSDSYEVLMNPSLKTPIGNFSVKETFAQNVKDNEDITNGFSDMAISYNRGSFDWAWSAPYILTMTPSVSLVVPLSQVSVKQNQLQTAISAGLSFGIKPDELYKTDGAWSLLMGVTAGRSIHAYEEDINGAVLNKYSSNQTLSIGYTISDWSFSFEFLNRVRWTYQNNMKTASFVASQEIGYNLTEHFNVAVGHTNEASAMKANGIDSNYNLVDEKTSTVYGTIGASF